MEFSIRKMWDKYKVIHFLSYCPVGLDGRFLQHTGKVQMLGLEQGPHHKLYLIS